MPNPTGPENTVRQFLHDLAESRTDPAIAALDDDVVYTNVGFATLRGRRQAGTVLGFLKSPYVGFDVQLTSIAVAGTTVLTERIDELRIGPLRTRFWVLGRFDVRDERIVLWRDYFDNVDIAKGIVRGLVALAVPSAQRSLTPIGSSSPHKV